MKAFVFGDIHQGRYGIKEVNDASLQIWEWVKTNSVDADIIIFLGDRFRSRDPEGIIRDISDKAVVELAKCGKIVICICGNHDYYYKFGSLENNYGVLEKWENIFIVKEKIVVEVGGKKCEFLPYGVEPNGVGDYLFMHDEIQGVGNLHWSKGVHKVSLQKYQRVYSGHIHKRIKDGNIRYVGTPYQQNFGDDELVGGVLLNIGTGDEEWIKGFGPKFVTGLKGNLENCIVRVESEEEKVRAVELGAIWVEVVGKKEEEIIQQVENENIGVGWKEWVNEYVDKYGEGNQLYKQVGEMILEE